MSRLLSALCMLASAAFAAEWQVLYPNVMTIAIGVSAPDNQNIYVSGANDGTGAAILKSEDEGASWSSLPHDPQMLYLDVDVAKGTTFGAAPGIGMFGLTSGSSFTSDGKTFQATPDTPLFAACQSASATSSSSFYLVGFWQKNIIDETHDGVIASLDGGKSLEYFDWAVDTPARYGSFPSNSTWFISGGTWPAELAGGASPSSSRKIGDSIYLSPRVQIKRLASGGSTFQISLDPLAMGKTGQEGYIGVIARTTDGGRTFQPVFNDTGRFYFNAIDCPDEQSCWAVAEGPAGAWIFNTRDAGKTWAEQYFVASAGLFDVKMVNAKEGWAVGGSITAVTFNALFLHTTDGGATWVNANTIANAYPNSITVVSQDRAYATAFLRNGLSSILAFK